MDNSSKLNLFAKTRYSLSEEDRVVNGLLLLLDHCTLSLSQAFLRLIGAPVDLRDPLLIRDHIPYAPESIVDGELTIPATHRIAIEAKLYKNQFQDKEQPERYLRLLREKGEPVRMLLLLSPDDQEPPVVTNNSIQSSSCYMTWCSWSEVYGFLQREQENPAHQAEPTRFLIAQYLDYLKTLGLNGSNGDSAAESTNRRPQLRFLLANLATEKILLHLYHHGGGNIVALARDHGLGTGATQRVLARLQKAGVIVRESRGRVTWYTLNPRSPLLKPLTELLRVVYRNTPDQLKKQEFEPPYKLDSLR